jgi:hypothetical protein
MNPGKYIHYQGLSTDYDVWMHRVGRFMCLYCTENELYRIA